MSRSGLGASQVITNVDLHKCAELRLAVKMDPNSSAALYTKAPNLNLHQPSSD